MNEISSRADAVEIVRHDSEQLGGGHEAHGANIASDEWLRLLLPAARAGLWDMDLVSKRVTWSPEMYELCGRDASLGPPTYEEAREMLHPADRLRVKESVEHVVAGSERGRAFDTESRIQRSNGATLWLSSSGHVEHDERGQPIRILGISRDITARKQAEQAHREGEEFIRKITELTPDLIVVYDRNDGRTIYSNRSLAEMLGYGAEQAHHTFDTFVRQTAHPDDVERLVAMRRSLQFLAHNVTIQYECRFRHADGTWRWFQTRIIAFARNSDRRVSQTLGIATDVTQRRQAEEELRRVNAELEQRVATRTAEVSKANRELQATNRELEAFAYSVSHDLRAPVRAIEGFSELLLEEFGAQLAPKAHTYLNEVRAGALRMSELIQALLALSYTTRGEITTQLVDLSALARTVIADLRRADPGREVEIQCVAQATATGDTKLLRIALENLFSNAWKFTAGRQRAVIEFGVRSELAEPIYATTGPAST